MKRLLLLCSGVVALGFFESAAAAPLGLRLALWSRSASQGQGEDPGPSKSIPEISPTATSDEVVEAIESVDFADEDAIKEVIGGSATEYAKFKEWASDVLDTAAWYKAGEEAVANAPYVAAAYVLGAEKLFVNEPVIEIQRLKVDSSDPGGGAPSSDGMSVRVVVWDGNYPVTCVAEKVAQLFEATGDLGDWDGDAKLGTSVTVESVMGREMNFKVVPGDGTAPRASLRLRK